jgi:hypothetical protein
METPTLVDGVIDLQLIRQIAIAGKGVKGKK